MNSMQGAQRRKKTEKRNGAESAPSFLLRTFEEEDFERLWEIDQACYEPGVAYSRRELKNYLSFPGAGCVVAVVAGAKGRHVTIGFCVTAQRSEWGYIVTMDVLAAWRRHRVGTMLLEDVERRMKARGVREVSLETAVDNDAGIAFWNKHGYRNRGVKKGYYPRGRDAYSMFKVLT